MSLQFQATRTLTTFFCNLNTVNWKVLVYSFASMRKTKPTTSGCILTKQFVTCIISLYVEYSCQGHFYLDGHLYTLELLDNPTCNRYLNFKNIPLHVLSQWESFAGLWCCHFEAQVFILPQSNQKGNATYLGCRSTDDTTEGNAQWITGQGSRVLWHLL